MKNCPTQKAAQPVPTAVGGAAALTPPPSKSTPPAPKPGACNAAASGREGGERPAGQKARKKTRRVRPAHGKTTLSPSLEPSPRPAPPWHDNAPAAMPASPRTGTLTLKPLNPYLILTPHLLPTPIEKPLGIQRLPLALQHLARGTPSPSPTQPRPGTNLGGTTAAPPPAATVSPGPERELDSCPAHPLPHLINWGGAGSDTANPPHTGHAPCLPPAIRIPGKAGGSDLGPHDHRGGWGGEGL
ncbi:atherin-like [Chiloscyllium plagiosum]|uniref:atherin-like n=1 Tax=Chiloscyllium plagiosum TaxID=36176 RepID=UPI001CB82575|nr:atherin-like [Chiloscyllium plagiosum]